MTCVTPDLRKVINRLRQPDAADEVQDETTTMQTLLPETQTSEITTLEKRQTTIPQDTQTMPTPYNVTKTLYHLQNKTHDIKKITINNGTHEMITIITITNNGTHQIKTTQELTLTINDRTKRDTDSLANNDEFILYVGFQLDGENSFSNFSILPMYENPKFFKFKELKNIRRYIPVDDRFLRIHVSVFILFCH